MVLKNKLKNLYYHSNSSLQELQGATYLFPKSKIQIPSLVHFRQKRGHKNIIIKNLLSHIQHQIRPAQKQSRRRKSGWRNLDL